MFEITRNDNEALEYYLYEGMAYKGAEYDFTFENRFLIYHAPVSNMIKYYALDMKTKLTSEVCSRQSGVYSEDEYKDLIPKVLSSIKYTGDRRCRDIFNTDPYEMIDTIFRIILPKYGYAIREDQINLCKDMYLGLTGKQVAICEAEVGTGKSMAYLVAALCALKSNKYKRYSTDPVTITTSSIELQKALIEKELPVLSNILMERHIIEKPLTGVLRKGKEHYFCRFRYNDFLRGIQTHPEKYRALIDYFTQSNFEETAFDLDKIKMAGSLKGRICVKGHCKNCIYASECKYKNFVRDAMSSQHHIDFQVTNHNLYLLSTTQRGILRSSSYVIVDEAHRLTEAAQQVFSAHISARMITRYLNAVKTKCNNQDNIQRFKALLSRVSEDSEQLFRLLNEQIDESDADDNGFGTIISLNSVHKHLLENIEENIALLENTKDSKAPSNGVREILGALRTFNESDSNGVWIEVDENGELFLCCCPRRIDEKLADNVWGRDCSHVLTSGTMSDGKSFKFFKRENGLNDLPEQLLLETQTPSPFDYANHTRLYIPDDMPLPDNESDEYINAVSDSIVRLVKATHGHTAILFTSYKVLQAVYEQTKDRLSEFDVICMTRSNKTAIADFKRSKNGVLFASGSMWEGVDCIGDTLSSVIIVRLPFPLRNIVTEQKKSEFQHIYSFVMRYAVPEMLIKLRQGAGRLVRSESDTGVLSILDARVAQKGAYRNKVLQALNKYPLIETEAEIAEFMRDVKSPEYFE